MDLISFIAGAVFLYSVIGVVFVGICFVDEQRGLSKQRVDIRLVWRIFYRGAMAVVMWPYFVWCLMD